MRVKQILMLSGFGVICIVLFINVRKDTPEEQKLTPDILEKINNIVSKSERFSQATPHLNTKKSLTKSNSNVIIEDENNLLSIAKKISAYNRTVLVTMVNDAYLKFTYSWLCNTRNMGIHKSVLIITTDQVSKENITRDWPEVSVIAMDMKLQGDQTYSKVGYVKIMVKRTEMILSILMADIEVFVFEVDCLWLANPVPELQNITGYDILVNPVARTNNQVFAGGFLWLYVTDKAKAVWKKVTEQMVALGERISKMSDNAAVSEGENDQQFFSRLINERYMNVSIKMLSLDVYADGQWYNLPETKRNQSHPVIINNNWVLVWKLESIQCLATTKSHFIQVENLSLNRKYGEVCGEAGQTTSCTPMDKVFQKSDTSTTDLIIPPLNSDITITPPTSVATGIETSIVGTKKLKEEIMWTLHTVSQHLKSNDDVTKCFPAIFQDSQFLRDENGNEAKINRAKRWKHWFINDDFTCDMGLVNQTVY